MTISRNLSDLANAIDSNGTLSVAGVNYNPVYNLSCTTWEDRAFFVRVDVQGFDCYVDTTYSINHLYNVNL